MVMPWMPCVNVLSFTVRLVTTAAVDLTRPMTLSVKILLVSTTPSEVPTLMPVAKPVIVNPEMETLLALTVMPFVPE